MQGRIIRGIAGFYYVNVAGSGIYECKARGIFRKEQMKPLVGDEVEIRVTDEQAREASIEAILPRKNDLIRPAVANVDQALLLFSLCSPDPDALLLDRFLVALAVQNIPAFLVFNKEDLAESETAVHWREVYETAGYDTCLISAAKGTGIDAVRRRLQDKTTVLAGPSGVGKSTLTNLLQDEIHMETGNISRKLKRGRHTTRRAELISLDPTTYLLDTPGFTSLYLPQIPKEQLSDCFPEFRSRQDRCRFSVCSHIHEPGCAVREALENGEISEERYKNYVRIYRELENQEKRRY